MNTMSKTFQTTNYPEAAPVASIPCWHSAVNDGRRLGFAGTLAEERVR